MQRGFRESPTLTLLASGEVQVPLLTNQPPNANPRGTNVSGSGQGYYLLKDEARKLGLS